jgi:hypothetical protein
MIDYFTHQVIRTTSLSVPSLCFVHLRFPKP